MTAARVLLEMRALRIVVAALGLAGGAPFAAPAQSVEPAKPSQPVATLEILDVTLESDITGGTLGDGVKAIDATKTKLMVLTVRFPRGGGYSTNELTVKYDLAGSAQRVECRGYAAVNGGWMFVRTDQGMSSLTFYPGGTGTIDMRLLFAVPREVAQVVLSFKGTVVGAPVALPPK